MLDFDYNDSEQDLNDVNGLADMSITDDDVMPTVCDDPCGNMDDSVDSVVVTNAGIEPTPFGTCRGGCTGTCKGLCAVGCTGSCSHINS